MTTTIIMPRLGETVTEGTVTKWLKQEGDQVRKDEVVVEISTDKIDTELPAPADGRLSKILVREETTVPVNTGLAEIEEASEETEMEAQEPAVPSSVTDSGAGTQKWLSPLVRKIAAEHDIDVARLTGTGLDGRITKHDVLRVIAQTETATPKAQPSGAPRPTPAVAPSPTPPTPAPAQPARAREQRVPISHMRRAIAEHMMRSIRTSAHVTAMIEADLTNVANLRSRLKNEFKAREGFSLTYMPFVAKVVVDVLREFQSFNATLDGDELVLRDYVNLGIAVDVPDGLIVPVIKDADNMGLLGLARAINDVATRARNSTLSPDDVHGGTFTITNPGGLGTIMQTPIINQPQVAILSLEAVQKRPVVIDDAIAIRQMVYLPLSYDHRVVDGALAARFLSGIKKALETEDFALELATEAG